MVVEQLLAGRTIGDPQIYKNLALYPLIAPEDYAPAYVLLDEALERQFARITEVSGAGSVPELAFENTSAEKILLVDGDELVGAKQNRVLNLSILVRGGVKIPIPVSCVEQGRWNYRSSAFAAAKRSLFAKARAKKMAHVSQSMRSGSRRSDQSEMWADVSEKLMFCRADSETMAMSDAYDATADRLDDYVRAFGAEPHQVGAVVALEGRVIGIELFDSSETFSKYLEKLVRAYAMDAIETADGAKRHAAKADVEAFIARIKSMAEERFTALGEGEDLRLHGEDVAGAALVVEGRVVHLAGYAVPS